MKPHKLAVLSACVFAGLTLPGWAQEKAATGTQIKMPAIFSEHMVLQRDRAVPVWGTASPGAKVTVKFRDQEKVATAGADGKWSVNLDPLTAGGPDTLTVNEVTLGDVLVGEVWIGSGQSNMDLGVGSFVKGDPVLAQMAGETYDQIRFNQSGGAWWTADPKGNSRISALLFGFGVRLHKELKVPVGLMEGAVNGTPSGYWLTEEMLKADAPAQASLARATEQPAFKEKRLAYEKLLVEWDKNAKEAAEHELKPPPKPQPPLMPGECRGQIGNLYIRHIQPMVGFAIRGVLWDQGESGTAIESLDWYHSMGALISGWRAAWGHGDFPFIYVQKPSGGGCAWDPTNPVTCKAEAFANLPAGVPVDGDSLRDYILLMNYTNTAMAVSSDLGAGLHPSNKSGYGHRAADVALGMVYGHKVEYYGPRYESHTVEDGKVRVKFTHVGQGLAFRHGEKLQGFAIAGADRKFQWADATIDGDTVVLTAAAVPKPVSVRYAWAGNRQWANLFNKDGLPAIPFRTDD